MKEITKIIRKRQSIYPGSYTDRMIEREILEEILDNAQHAPNHKRTFPWRFKVYTGKGLNKLSEDIRATYAKARPGEQFKEMTAKKLSSKPVQSGAAIAICMQRDPKASLPEWEEVAAVACAVQNMWLTCTAYDIGAYWSSPGVILDNASDFIELQDGEKCIGIFYMGYYEEEPPLKEREPIFDKLTWVE